LGLPKDSARHWAEEKGKHAPGNKVETAEEDGRATVDLVLVGRAY